MTSTPILEWKLPAADLHPQVEEKQVAVRIRQKLAQSAYRAVQRIACDVRHGKLRLHGQIPDYLLHQVTHLVAEELYPHSSAQPSGS
jgi:hypothetical protein